MKQISDIDIQDQKYTKTNISSLNSQYGLIDWQVLFKHVGANVNQAEPVYLYLEDYYFKSLMNKLNTRIEDEIIQILKLYYRLQLYQNLMTPKENNHHFCIKQAIQLMPEIVESTFLKNSARSNQSEHLRAVFDELKDKFYWLIGISDLENNNKDVFQNKLKALRLEFITSDVARNTFVEKNYQYFKNDYLSNLFMLLEDKRSIDLVKGRTLVFNGAHQHFQFPKVIPNTGTISIPNVFIHVLQNKIESSCILEAYIKFHLSRAIALYLDEVARNLNSIFYSQFQNGLNIYWDSIDNKRNWRGQQLLYKENYQDWMKVAEASTPNRMADNIALQIAYQSIFPKNVSIETLPWISDDYDPEKQFFILVAQDYCESPTLSELAQNLYETANMPSMFRINFMIMNSQDFGATFMCPQGSQMNPEEKMEFDSFKPQYVDGDDYGFEEVQK